MTVPNARMFISGGVVLLGVGLVGTGVASASSTAKASASSTPAVVATNCPIPGSFGNGTPATADAAFAALSPTSPSSPTTSGGLAFTGVDYGRELAAGAILLGTGAVLVTRTRRRPVASADGTWDDDALRTD
jgi:hypothetical protein